MGHVLGSDRNNWPIEVIIKKNSKLANSNVRLLMHQR